MCGITVKNGEGENKRISYWTPTEDMGGGSQKYSDNMEFIKWWNAGDWNDL